jgi:hypothetical protein
MIVCLSVCSTIWRSVLGAVTGTFNAANPTPV